MKVSIVVLLLLVALLVQSPLAANTEKDVQEICGKDAGEFYKNRFESSFEKGTTTYRPYYNKNLNTCFVSISIHGYRRSTVKINSIYTALFDLKRWKELGSLFQVYGDPEEPDAYCTMLGKPVTKCVAADWDAFIQRYMQEE